MQRFEYLVVRTAFDKVHYVNGEDMLIDMEDIWDYLNVRGSEGWELVAVAVTARQAGDSFTYTLKRPLS